MIFTHDVEHSLVSVVDLVNTGVGAGPGADDLADVAALKHFVAEHEVSEVARTTPQDVDQVRAVRERFREVFRADSDAVAARLINALIVSSPVVPRLTDHDGYDWHVHYFAPGASVAEHLAVDGGMTLALVVAGGERDRLRHCEAPDCERVLVDLSRNRSKRYCDSRTCGNRLHVAAYRERRRADLAG